MSIFFTGKSPAVFHKTLPLARSYQSQLLLPIPASSDYSALMGQVGILNNDTCGCCSIATSLHAMQLWTANAGSIIMPDDACCMLDYEAMTGYDPATGANDTGCNLLQKNQHWMNTGFAVNANGAWDKLDGFAQIEAGDIETLRRTVAYFECAELGVQLPDNAQQEFSSNGMWTDTSLPPNPNEGHDVLIVGQNAQGFKIATWTGFVFASTAWVMKYMDEGTMLLRRSILKPNGISASGITMDQLDSMIRSARGVLSPSAA